MAPEEDDKKHNSTTVTNDETQAADVDVGRDQKHADVDNNNNNDGESSSKILENKAANSSNDTTTQDTREETKEDSKMTPPPPISTIEEEETNGSDYDKLTPFEKALQVYENRANFIDHHQIASWLGGEGDPDRADIRLYYMSFFDWKGKSVLSAVRNLCDRLYLKAESQQLDRIIDSFADRWCECNPQHGFKSPGVIYTLAYSILLLNTDHHSEDYQSGKKMTKSQYVQQTLTTMKNLLQAEDCHVSNDNNNDLESVTSHRKSSIDSHRSSIYGNGSGSINNKKRWSITGMGISTNNDNDSLIFVNDTKLYSFKEWESNITQLLKTVYSSIDSYPLNLARGSRVFSGGGGLYPQSSYSSLNLQQSNRSFNSITPSESSKQQQHSPSLIQRFSMNRRSSWISGEKWSDYNYQEAVISNNPNEDGGSLNRPNSRSSFHGGRHFYLAKQRSMYSEFPAKNTYGLENIGFAGALRNTMIKEENNNSSSHGGNSSISSSQDNNNQSGMTFDNISTVSDTASFMTSEQESILPNSNNYNEANNALEPIQETLALHGAPWAKEGLLKFQAYLDSSNVTKKYKKRDWVEVFVVVQNGYLKMFRFDTPKHMNRRSKINNTSDVGGGNWLDNATMTDNVSLAHTMAQVNPENKESEGGSSNKRSSIVYVSSSTMAAKSDATQWSLNLPNQAVLLFLAGTKEIAEEYVYSCNYWAARVSKEPLVEPVSSMEFGWERPMEILEEHKKEETVPNVTPVSFDVLNIDNERIQVKEWKPPVQSTAHCTYGEDEQLKSLKTYIDTVKEALEKHSSIRGDMMKIFQSGHLVSTRAHANWGRRSQYLLTEIVKYDTYVTTLERAVKDRCEVENPEEDEEGKGSEYDGGNEDTDTVRTAESGNDNNETNNNTE